MTLYEYILADLVACGILSLGVVLGVGLERQGFTGDLRRAWRQFRQRWQPVHHDDGHGCQD